MCVQRIDDPLRLPNFLIDGRQDPPSLHGSLFPRHKIILHIDNNQKRIQFPFLPFSNLIAYRYYVTDLR